jgi:hypothetical protein
MSLSKLSRSSHVDNIVFISGITRSGKSLLLPIVSSFENSEKVNVNFFLELMTAMNSTDEISDDAAIYLLRSGMNIMAYDNAIGRNVNFRKDDYTSVWKYKEPLEYISRLAENDGDRVFRKIDKEGRLFPLMWHNGLWYSDILFKAFPMSKILHVYRNPIDIVYSWIKKDYGGNFYSNKRASTSLTYKFKDEILPHYAYGWEDEYLSLNGVDRIINMVYRIRQHHTSTYNKLSEENKKQVLFVSFEKLIHHPDDVIPNITNFLNTSSSKHTQKILQEEKCPRVHDPKSIERKLNLIKSKSSNLSVDILMKMVYEFEHNSVVI